MPRRSRSRSPSRGSSPFSRRTGSYAQSPRRAAPSPSATRQPAGRSGGLFSGMGSMLMGGMALGAGSEMGHQATRSLMGGRSNDQPDQYRQESTQPFDKQSEPQNQEAPCQAQNEEFIRCLRNNSESISSCQHHLDALKECEKRHSNL